MGNVLDDGGLSVLDELVKQVNQLTADITTLTAAFSAHTHTALNTAIIAGQQSTVKTTTIVKKK